ncbi:hypothetical protein ID866_10727, partial [Astraeus odoratus]
MQTRLCARTQTEHKDAEHYLSGSCQIPTASDRHPPLSARCSSPTTPRQEPCIRTLTKELEDTEFRTPDSPGGNDPDSGDPDDPDDDGDNDNITSKPSSKDNPFLALTNTITRLSNATRCRPKDSGAARTKVHEPNTFDSMDLKKLCEFLVQCELNFRDRLQAFHSDAWKGIDARYWECKSEIAHQAKTNPQSSSSSKQSSSGGSSSKQSNPSSGASSSSSTGKGKNPQHPSSSTPKSSDS